MPFMDWKTWHHIIKNGLSTTISDRIAHGTLIEFVGAGFLTFILIDMVSWVHKIYDAIMPKIFAWVVLVLGLTTEFILQFSGFPLMFTLGLFGILNNQ